MSKYQEAIDNGYTDEEIKSFLGDKYSNAISEGYTQQEIESHLGTPSGFFNPTKQEDNIDANMIVGKPKTEKQTMVENDDIYKKKMDLLNLNLDSKLKSLDELNLTDDEKQVFTDRLKAQKDVIQAKEENDAWTRQIKETKTAPSINTSNNTLNKDKTLYDKAKEFESVVMQPFNPAIDLALHYAKKVGSAIGETAEQGMNHYLGTDFSFYENNSNKLREEGTRLNQAIDPENKLALSPTKTTDLFASIAVPFNVTTPSKMLALEGLMGYTVEHSQNSDFIDSLRAGALQSSTAGAGRMVGDWMMGLIQKSGTEKALEYLWEKHSPELIQASGLTEGATKSSVIRTIEDRWLNIMQGESSNENKIRAIIDSLGEQGASYKRTAQTLSDVSAEANVRSGKYSRIQDLRTETAGANIEDVSGELSKQVGMSSEGAENTIRNKMLQLGATPEAEDRAVKMFSDKLKKGSISKIYGDFVDAAKSKYSDTYNIDNNVLNSVKNDLSERFNLTKGLSSSEANLASSLDKPMTIYNMLGVKRDINTLIRNSDGVQKTNAVTLRSEMDSILKQTMSKEDYNLLNQLDTEWANKSKVTGTKSKDLNQIATRLMSFANGNKTLDSVVSDLDSLDVGTNSFKQLEKLVGTKNVAKLEKGIVNSMLQGNVDDISYDVINNSLKNMGFVSEEGKQLKKIIDDYDTIFSADNFSGLNKQISNTGEYTPNALTADLIAKLKYTASSSIFAKLRKTFFTSKQAEESRNIGEIADVLTSKHLGTHGIDILNNPNTRDIVRDSITDAYKAQIKTMKENGNNINISDEEVDKEVNQAMLGLQDKYGGKATKGYTPKEGDKDWYQSLTNQQKQIVDEVQKVDNSGRLGMSSQYGGQATKGNTPQGTTDWFASLTNKQKEEAIQIVESKKDVTGGYGLTDLYNEQINKISKGGNSTPSYKDISDSLFGTKKQVAKDTSGNLGMTSNYGGKATGTGGVNTTESKQYLDRFMNDIANPKVEVKQHMVNDLYDALKSEGTTMNNASVAKEKAWNNAMDIVNYVRKQDKIDPKVREQMIKKVKDYYDVINKNI